MVNVCSVPNCSFIPVGYQQICLMHGKQNKMKAMQILSKIQSKLGTSKWETFLESLRNYSNEQSLQQHGDD